MNEWTGEQPMTRSELDMTVQVQWNEQVGERERGWSGETRGGGEDLQTNGQRNQQAKRQKEEETE